MLVEVVIQIKRRHTSNYYKIHRFHQDCSSYPNSFQNVIFSDNVNTQTKQMIVHRFAFPATRLHKMNNNFISKLHSFRFVIL